MLSTKHLATVAAEARRAGAKLILAGDDWQLASIERGGMFGALRQWHGVAELHEVVRVSDSEQRRTFNLMHRGEFLPARPLDRPCALGGQALDLLRLFLGDLSTFAQIAGETARRAAVIARREVAHHPGVRAQRQAQVGCAGRGQGNVQAFSG
jgi:hypothetical protein